MTGRDEQPDQGDAGGPDRSSPRDRLRESLQARLIHLAEIGITGPEGRMLQAGSPERLLRRVVATLDGIVLSRVVRLRAEGSAVALWVSNRRILELTVDGEALSPLTADGIAAALRTTLGDATAATVRIDQPEAPHRSPDGVSVSLLAEAMGVPASAASPVTAEPLETLLAAHRAAAVAWLRRGSAPTGTPGGDDRPGHDEEGGPDITLRALRDWADAQGAAPEGEPWSLYAVAGADGMTHVLAELGSQQLALTLPVSELGALTARWQRMLLL